MALSGMSIASYRHRYRNIEAIGSQLEKAAAPDGRRDTRRAFACSIYAAAIIRFRRRRVRLPLIAAIYQFVSACRCCVAPTYFRLAVKCGNA